MPIIIGNFISRHVYDSKLKTEHQIDALRCCRFVDVSNGEEIKNGKSWTVCLSSETPFHLTSRLKSVYYPERRRGQSRSSNRTSIHQGREKFQNHHSLRRPAKRDRRSTEDGRCQVGKYSLQRRLFPRKRGRPHRRFDRPNFISGVHGEQTTDERHVVSVQEEYDDLDAPRVFAERGRSGDARWAPR